MRKAISDQGQAYATITDRIRQERTVRMPRVQSQRVHGPRVRCGGDFVQRNEQIAHRRESFLADEYLPVERVGEDAEMEI